MAIMGVSLKKDRPEEGGRVTNTTAPAPRVSIKEQHIAAMQKHSHSRAEGKPILTRPNLH